MISDKEFLEWLEHPVTKAVQEYCSRRCEEMRTEWERSAPTDFLRETYVMGNIANIGKCESLREIENLDHERLIGVLNERE